MLGLVILNQ